MIYLVNWVRVSIAWESMLLRDGMGGHKNIQSHQLDPNYLAVSTPSKYASRSQVRQFWSAFHCLIFGSENRLPMGTYLI